MSRETMHPAPLEYRQTLAVRHRSPWTPMARTVGIIGILCGLIYGFDLLQDANYFRSPGAFLAPSPSLFSPSGVTSSSSFGAYLKVGFNASAATLLIVGGMLICFKVRNGRTLIFIGSGWITALAVQQVINAFEYSRAFASDLYAISSEGLILPLASIVYLLLTSIILTRPTLFQRT
jgi:hypothetical protein